MVKKFVGSFDSGFWRSYSETKRFYVGSESEFLLRSFGFFYLLLGDTAFGCGLASEGELQRRHSFCVEVHLVWGGISRVHSKRERGLKG
jgi:hypothetical protein